MSDKRPECPECGMPWPGFGYDRYEEDYWCCRCEESFDKDGDYMATR